MPDAPGAQSGLSLGVTGYRKRYTAPASVTGIAFTGILPVNNEQQPAEPILLANTGQVCKPLCGACIRPLLDSAARARAGRAARRVARADVQPGAHVSDPAADRLALVEAVRDQIQHLAHIHI